MVANLLALAVVALSITTGLAPVINGVANIKVCKHTFSVTSGTIFANAKMPLRVHLAAIAIYSNHCKGYLCAATFA